MFSKEGAGSKCSFQIYSIHKPKISSVINKYFENLGTIPESLYRLKKFRDQNQTQFSLQLQLSEEFENPVHENFVGPLRLKYQENFLIHNLFDFLGTKSKILLDHTRYYEFKFFWGPLKSRGQGNMALMPTLSVRS